MYAVKHQLGLSLNGNSRFWRRSCNVKEISENGVKIAIQCEREINVNIRKCTKNILLYVRGPGNSATNKKLGKRITFNSKQKLLHTHIAIKLNAVKK